MARRYYVNTVSRDHVQRGVAGGFTQANHGRPTGLKQLKRGDLVRYKSPVELQLMRAVKAAFDPHSLMNPGKVL